MNNMINRDPLPLIREIFRQHTHRPTISASFFADQAMQRLGLSPDNPERERYRAAADDWLRRKFDPLHRRHP